MVPVIMERAQVGCTRELLSQAIIGTILSWPEVERRLFACIRYEAKDLNQTAETLGLSLDEARRILDVCDAKLRASLRDFVVA